MLTSPAVAAAVPPRMRSQAFALVGLYVFLLGGFLGNLLAGSLSDALGERAALLLVVPPAALIGGAFIVYGSRFLMADMALVVEELQEEAGERRRIAEGASVPVLQARNLDVSYGSVQVLFDCAIDVHQGEVVALLGTNGAGKSTLLRALMGLAAARPGGRAARGRHHLRRGRVPVRQGIVQVPRRRRRVRRPQRRPTTSRCSFTAHVRSRPCAGEDPSTSSTSSRPSAADADPGRRRCRAASSSSSPSPGRSSTTPTSSSSTSSRSAWPRSCRVAARGRRAAAGAGPDDDHRRAVVQPGRSSSPSGRCTSRRGRVRFEGAARRAPPARRPRDAVFLGAGVRRDGRLLGGRVPSQILFNGSRSGSATRSSRPASCSIFRSSGIINFAQAAIGASASRRSPSCSGRTTCHTRSLPCSAWRAPPRSGSAPSWSWCGGCSTRRGSSCSSPRSASPS